MPDEVAPPRPPHVHEVDVVRLLTFVCVIGVHAVPLTTSDHSGLAGAVEMPLHFTRNAFFLLTAFVLAYGERRRRVPLRRSLPRRLGYVGAPYVVWTLAYWWIGAGGQGWTPGGLRVLALDLLTGTGEYHLYFLLVSMQLYLVLPVLLTVLRRTAGHHGALFSVSLVCELLTMALAHWVRWPGSLGEVLQAHDYVLLPTYQFYFVAGALAAVHHERLAAWVARRPVQVLGVLAAAGLLHEGSYLVQEAATGSPAAASDPLQPTMVPWSLAVTLALYAVGAAYARRRRDRPRLARLVELGSLVSFGVYLVHPLVLNVLLGPWLGYGSGHLAPPASTVVAWVGTLLASFTFAAVVVRTPLALPLTGRRRLAPPARSKPEAVRPAAVGAA